MNSEAGEHLRASILEARHTIFHDNDCSCDRPPSLKKDNTANGEGRSQSWNHQLEFSLGFCSMLFRNSGLYLFISYCCKYGGMSFSAAYAIAMAVVGLPTVLIMVAIGQYSRSGPLKCWSFYPALCGLGLSLMMLSGLHRAPNLVVASESIYLATMLMESAKLPQRNGTVAANQCESPLLSGFCKDAIKTKLHGRNITQADCAGLGLTLDKQEWGVCGRLDQVRLKLSTLDDSDHHYLWKQVAIYNFPKAHEYFARDKLLATDLLTGKMRRGFRTVKSKKKLHWTLVTFVFTLSYCGLLVILMVDESVLLTVLHAIGTVSSACLIGLNCFAVFFVSNVASVNQGWLMFGQTKHNYGLLSQPSIWVDALLLVLWNTGCCSGCLIHLAKRNSFGQEYFGSCMLQTVAHCLLYSLCDFCFCIVQSHAKGLANDFTDPCLLCRTYGYAHTLLELQPSTLVSISQPLSILPLVCFAAGELCAFASFSIGLVSSVVDFCRHRLEKHSGLLHLLVFAISVVFCLPLCFQFGGAIVYDYLRTTWGWNAILLVAAQLFAFWSFVRPSGIALLFKHLGIGQLLSRLIFWWRLCWFGYTPVLLTLVLTLLVLDSVRQFGVSWKGAKQQFMSGPLHGLSDGQMRRSLADWWIIELVRAATLLPLLLLLLLIGCCCRGGGGSSGVGGVGGRVTVGYGDADDDGGDNDDDKAEFVASPGLAGRGQQEKGGHQDPSMSSPSNDDDVWRELKAELLLQGYGAR